MIFFVSWGSKPVLKWLGLPEEKTCSNCRQKRNFQLALQYRSHHLYWVIPTTVSNRQYYLLCTVCQHGWKIDTPVVGTFILKDPIPFTHRWGWLINTAVIVAAVVLIVWGNS